MTLKSPMPIKKKSASVRPKIAAAQKTETDVHLSVAQKVGVAITLLAGFSALAAGFAALPRRAWQRPPRENPPAYSENQQKRAEEQEKTKTSAQILTPGVSISAFMGAEPLHLVTGQNDITVLNAKLLAIADDVQIKEVTFRINSLTAKPMDGIENAFMSFALSSASASWGQTAVASNGFVTFSNINQTIKQGEAVDIRLSVDVADAGNVNAAIFGQPFVFKVDTELQPPKMIGIGSGQNAIVEGLAQSATITLTRASLSQSFNVAGKATPEGFVSKSPEQVIAIVNVSNSSPNGYEAFLSDFRMNKTVQGISGEGMLRVYKDSVSSGNLLGEAMTSWEDAEFIVDDVSFKDVVIPAGSTRQLYITLDTLNPTIAANDVLCVKLSPYMSWTDGAKLYTQLSVQDTNNKCMIY